MDIKLYQLKWSSLLTKYTHVIMKEKQKTNNKHLNFDTDKKKVGSVGDKNMYVYFLIITSKKCCNNVSFICRVFGMLYLFSCSTCFLFFLSSTLWRSSIKSVQRSCTFSCSVYICFGLRWLWFQLKCMRKIGVHQVNILNYDWNSST